MEKLCPKCDRVKPLDDFYKWKRGTDGHQKICKECSKQYSREQWVRTHRHQPAYRRHHLTAQRVEEILISQGRVCAICKLKPADRVDHDHGHCPTTFSCGQCVRGILCHPCNTALGLMKENISSIQRMIEYLMPR